MKRFRARTPKAIASAEIERIRAGKKITYYRIARAIEELTGHSRHDVEIVLRAYHELTGPESDFDCELSNEVHNLDPQWAKWDPRGIPERTNPPRGSHRTRIVEDA